MIGGAVAVAVVSGGIGAVAIADQSRPLSRPAGRCGRGDSRQAGGKPSRRLGGAGCRQGDAQCGQVADRLGRSEWRGFRHRAQLGWPDPDQQSRCRRSAGPSGHASDGDIRATVTFSDGQTVPFAVVGTDPAGDIAVVRAQGVSGLTPITLGSSADVEVGQDVVAIGSPLGLQGTVTTGIVSALHRPVSAGGDSSGETTVLDAIQTDAAINPGNSGGALVNMNGELIGVNSAIATLGGGQQGSPGAPNGSIGLGFAIPVDQAKRIADELISNGTATHGSLGVQLSNDTTARGASIAGVVDGSPAAAAGVPSGAVITKVDERVIDGPEALVAAVRSKAPGDTVTLTYLDESGTAQTAQVTLGQA